MGACPAVEANQTGAGARPDWCVALGGSTRPDRRLASVFFGSGDGLWRWRAALATFDAGRLNSLQAESVCVVSWWYIRQTPAAADQSDQTRLSLSHTTGASVHPVGGVTPKGATAAASAESGPEAEEEEEEAARPFGSVSIAAPGAAEAATTSVATRHHQPTSRRASYNQTVPRSAAAGGAACEMRRTPSQNKVDKSGSPRVTLRLHQVKSRDDKRSLQTKDAANYETRLQFSIMDQKAEDIYEFKSSKDGAPNSPSDAVDKDSENISANAPPPSQQPQQQPSSPRKELDGNGGGTAEKEAAPKRSASDLLDGADDDESRRKRRKEDNNTSGKGPGRSAGVPKKAAAAAKGQQAASSGQNSKQVERPSDRKSPASGGNSPKSKTGDSESDGDDTKRELSGPKVPPLKIVIPQQSGGEQEQGTRNGKNGNGRHQALPYVVTTSSSNDSDTAAASNAAPDKLETTPAATATATKEDKKDAATLQ
ncbi:Hypothetical predicted protein, partial [Cloeon dipterum]